MQTFIFFFCMYYQRWKIIIEFNAIEEERINRVKHWAGIPIKSIKECLVQSNISADEITDIAINTNPLSNFKKNPFF